MGPDAETYAYRKGTDVLGLKNMPPGVRLCLFAFYLFSFLLVFSKFQLVAYLHL